MKALRISEPAGLEGIDGLVYEDAPDPQPAIGDALVQVHAASFTPTELTWPLWTDRAGYDPGADHPGARRVGRGCCARLRRRRGGRRRRGLRTHRRLPRRLGSRSTSSSKLAPSPRSRRHSTMSTPRHSRKPPCTSWEPLFDHGHLEAGQTVVIHGAGRRRRIDRGTAGKTGGRPRDRHRPGRRRGACARARRRPLRRRSAGRLGGRRRQRRPGLRRDRRRSARPFVVIVKPGGALVSVMAPPPAGRDDIRTLHFVRDPNGSQLADITRLVDEGKLHPQVGAIYPLAEGREAFMAKSTQHIPGKVVLQADVPSKLGVVRAGVLRARASRGDRFCRAGVFFAAGSVARARCARSSATVCSLAR